MSVGLVGRDIREWAVRFEGRGHVARDSSMKELSAFQTLAPAALVAVALAFPLCRLRAGAGPGPPARGPAPTLSSPATRTRAPDGEGFIQRWLILEPIPASGLTDSDVQKAVKTEYFPGQFTVVPKDGDKVSVNGTPLTWHAEDTTGYNVNLYHFAHALNRPTSNVLFWAVTVVHCPREMRDVRLAIGSNAASVWWVNGREVVGIYGDRQTVIDDGVSKRVTLRKGPNVVRCAVVNGGGATDFCARFLDSNGEPVRDITVSLGQDGT
jgi:hypothetical protein